MEVEKKKYASIFHSHCIALNQDKLLELDLKRLNSSAPSRCSTLLPAGDRPRPPAEGHSLRPAGADPHSDHITPSWDPLQHTDHSPAKPERCCIRQQITEPSSDL